MKKLLLFAAIVGSLWTSNANAQDIINLLTTESVGTVLAAYTGTGDNVTVVIPAGYTSVEYTGTTPTNIIIPATIKNLTIKGDGSNPTVLMKGFTLPASSLTSLTVKDLTLKGIEDVTTGTLSLGNYFAQSGSVAINSVTIDNCTLANFRGIFRMNSGNNFGNVIINNCIIRNIGNYNIFNTAAGATLGNLTFKNSTVYGINGNVFGLSAVTPAAISISDCTFDNIGYTTAKYFIDMGTDSTTVLTIKNTILGKTITTGAKGIRYGGLSYTYSTTNSYTTTDWVTATNAVIGFTAYANASTSLFKTPTTYDGASAVATIGNYTLIDNTVGRIGDPRWLAPTAVNSPKSTTAIIFNGTEISLNEAQDIAIYSVTGSLLKSAKKASILSTADLSKGIYLVKAGTAVQKFAVR